MVLFSIGQGSEALEDGAQFRGRGGVGKRVKDVSAQGSLLDLDSALVVGVAENVFGSADENPEGIFQFAIVIHHLDRRCIFPPNDGTYDCQGDFADIVRVVIGAGHHSAQIFLKTVNIGNGGRHELSSAKFLRLENLKHAEFICALT
jgi:hypothetical protein